MMNRLHSIVQYFAVKNRLIKTYVTQYKKSLGT